MCPGAPPPIRGEIKLGDEIFMLIPLEAAMAAASFNKI